MSFGKTLKKVMDERGLKAADIADEMITVQYISKLVCGRTKSPTWEKAVHIAENLGMTPSEFRALELEYDSGKVNKKAR
jgi:transcriptional regulator with XRE-family HTH domain